eukprot:2310738-Rhodomonas_salina.4
MALSSSARPSYGAIPAAAPAEGGETKRSGAAHLRGSLVLVAVSCMALAAVVLMLASQAQTSNDKAVELGFYANKFRDVFSAGGNWMQCLRCRKDQPECHPTYAEREGKRDPIANACPPHAGMVTVLVRRGAKLETKWMDKEMLEKALESAKKSDDDEEAAGDEEEEHAGGEEEAEEDEGEPICVRPTLAGMREHMWPEDEDCMS